METKSRTPPVRVWHTSWERNKVGNVGLVIATVVIDGRTLCWTIPPGSQRPLTFEAASLTPVDGDVL